MFSKLNVKLYSDKFINFERTSASNTRVDFVFLRNAAIVR